MKLITRDTDYAVRALCCIAKNTKSRLSVDDLVVMLGIPKAFLRKILQTLTKKGILKSYKGHGGGFSLEIKPSKISLLHLMEAFQGKLKLNECTFRKSVCKHTPSCGLKKKIDGIQKYVIAELKNVTLECLLKGSQHG